MERITAVFLASSLLSARAALRSSLSSNSPPAVSGRALKNLPYSRDNTTPIALLSWSMGSNPLTFASWRMSDTIPDERNASDAFDLRGPPNLYPLRSLWAHAVMALVSLSWMLV